MIKTHHGIDSLDRGGIEYPNLAAPVSMWTIPSDSQGQLRASGDTFYQKGISGWHEVAWYEFVVEEAGDYEFSFNYDVPVLSMWSGKSELKHFGLYIAPSQPSVGNNTESFYKAKSNGVYTNRIGRDVAFSNGNNLSGKVSNIVHLTAGHWWIWFPAAVVNDYTDYNFTFSNIVVRRVKVNNSVRVPSSYTKLEYIHNDNDKANIVAHIDSILNTDVTFGAVFYRDYDDYQQSRSDVRPFAFSTDGVVRIDSENYSRTAHVRIWNAYGNSDTFLGSNGGVGYVRSDAFGKVATRVKGNVEIVNNYLYFFIDGRLAGAEQSEYDYAQKTYNYCDLFGAFQKSVSQQEELPQACCLLGRLYEVYAKSGDTYLVRFIPVKRKSDNVLGFYELVSGQFFTDMNFQENFTAGPEVT